MNSRRLFWGIAGFCLISAEAGFVAASRSTRPAGVLRFLRRQHRAATSGPLGLYSYIGQNRSRKSLSELWVFGAHFRGPAVVCFPACFNLYLS